MISTEDKGQLQIILSESTGVDYPFDLMLFGDNPGTTMGDYGAPEDTCHVLEEMTFTAAESVVTDAKVGVGATTTTNKRKMGAVRKPKVEGEEDEERMKRNRDGSDGGNTQREEWKEKKERKEKADFIHVRARRGQATDSHSLAERVRRERISERMKHLQDLVPGCNKITGKAGMLDEIINYVQSLQRQVEFLSMKLAAMDAIPSLMEESCFREEEVGSLIMGNSMYPNCSVAQLLEVEMGEEVDIQGGIHTVSDVVTSPDLSWLPPPLIFPHIPDSGEGMWMGRGDPEVMRWGG